MYDKVAPVRPRMICHHPNPENRTVRAISGADKTQIKITGGPTTILDRSPAVADPGNSSLRNRSNLPGATSVAPHSSNLTSMLLIRTIALSPNQPSLEFMTHSSELLSRASPYFPRVESTGKLHRDLKELFSQAASILRQYADRISQLSVAVIMLRLPSKIRTRG